GPELVMLRGRNSNTLTTGRPALRFGLSDVSHVTSLAERPRARQGTRRPSGACGRMPQRARAGRRRARPLRRGTNQRADRSVPPSPPSRAERAARQGWGDGGLPGWDVATRGGSARGARGTPQQRADRRQAVYLGPHGRKPRLLAAAEVRRSGPP